MKITFAITTIYEDVERIRGIIRSIVSQNIPEYEILIIGGDANYSFDDLSPNVRCIKFDETVRPGWITKKKNILCQESKYENIVLMHDYFIFDLGWYQSMSEFTEKIDWDICSCRHFLINGKRHSDWIVWDDPIFPRYSLLPYDEWSRTQYMFICGTFFMVKKYVVMEEPFNENLLHCQSEDIDWSLRVRNKYKIVCNGNATVRHNKIHRDAI